MGFSFDRSLLLDTETTKGSALLNGIQDTQAFKRLDNVRFLGGIDYVLVRSPNGASTNVRYTRRQHSLGVARLALQYAVAKGISSKDARTIFVAALLHDIGHAPFSHSLEPVFKQEFGIAHHEASEDIIFGRVPIGQDLASVLRSFNIDAERVVAVINGDEKGFDDFFSGPINFDTIEGITRSLMYGKSSPHWSKPSAIVDAAMYRKSERDRELVDGFWRQKDDAYRYIIGSPLGVLSDFACQYFLRSNLSRISRADYFSTEEAMFRKLTGLHQILTSRTFETDVAGLLSEPLTFTSRQFFIDESGDFFARDDARRYRQTREKRVLQPKIKGQEIEAGDLFNEYVDRKGEEVFRH